MCVDERDHFVDWRSSSAPKKADAAFKMSFARRNSAFSRLRSLQLGELARSSLPAGAPLSISAWRTHIRTVSGFGPSFSATEQIASHCDPYSCLMIQHHPHRTLTQLVRVLSHCLA